MTGASSVATSFKLPRLPACRICQSKKIKCDSLRPKCEPCTSNGTECTIAIPNQSSVISREYIHELEQRQCASISATLAKNRGERRTGDSTSPATVTTKSSNPHAAVSPTTDLQGGGLSFMTLLFAEPEWRDSNANLKVLNQTARPAEPNITPNELPSPMEARSLFDRFLEEAQVHHPFLPRGEIQELYERVFQKSGQEAPTYHDLYRSFMILAIASVVPYQQGLHAENPLGYYLAAMHYFDTSTLSRGISAIQDLLLVCRFGIYHHIGISIWEIIQLCMRMCAELGLQKPRMAQTSLLEEQNRRRVFWTCYLMDRYSSYTLNRPFAIADRDIHIDVPVSANDEEIIAASSFEVNLDMFSLNHVRREPNDMTVALYCIKLRQITSRIHCRITELWRIHSSPNQNETFLVPGRIYTIVQEFVSELKYWRDSAPDFEHPRCLYERKDYYEFLEARETLILVRKAIDLTPKRNGLPTEYILTLCLQCARRTILLYSDLFRRSLVTYTRSYFHTLFTAGLSVLFCISVCGATESENIEESREALAQCEETMKKMATGLLDAGPYAIAFSALHKRILQKPHVVPTTSQTISQPTGQVAEHQVYPSDLLMGIGEGARYDQSGFRSMYAGPGTMDDHAAYNDGSTFGSRTYGEMLSGTDEFMSNDPLPWASLDYDALWNMGQFTYGDPLDVQGMFGGVNF